MGRLSTVLHHYFLPAKELIKEAKRRKIISSYRLLDRMLFTIKIPLIPDAIWCVGTLGN